MRSTLIAKIKEFAPDCLQAVAQNFADSVQPEMYGIWIKRLNRIIGASNLPNDLNSQIEILKNSLSLTGKSAVNIKITKRDISIIAGKIKNYEYGWNPQNLTQEMQEWFSNTQAENASATLKIATHLLSNNISVANYFLLNQKTNNELKRQLDFVSKNLLEGYDLRVNIGNDNDLKLAGTICQNADSRLWLALFVAERVIKKQSLSVTDKPLNKDNLPALDAKGSLFLDIFSKSSYIPQIDKFDHPLLSDITKKLLSGTGTVYEESTQSKNDDLNKLYKILMKNFSDMLQEPNEYRKIIIYSAVKNIMLALPPQLLKDTNIIEELDNAVAVQINNQIIDATTLNEIFIYAHKLSYNVANIISEVDILSLNQQFNNMENNLSGEIRASAQHFGDKENVKGKKRAKNKKNDGFEEYFKGIKSSHLSVFKFVKPYNINSKLSQTKTHSATAGSMSDEDFSNIISEINGFAAT